MTREPTTSKVRPAFAQDVEAITAIYNEGIEDRVATVETQWCSVTEIGAWLSESRPLLVAEAPNGAILGFARVSPYSKRAAYATLGEHAVYVAPEPVSAGSAPLLLDELVHAAEDAGLHKLTSRVFTDNVASRAVHRAGGFEEVGIQRRHAKRDGEWKDCVLVERLLGEAAIGEAQPTAGRTEAPS